MGGRGVMLVLSSGDGVIVEKVGRCRKWLVGWVLKLICFSPLDLFV